MNDYAGLLSPAERERLEALLAERERAAGTQMAIAVFRSLEGESVEDVANRLFQKWRLGSKALDNGVLLVVFVQDRKLRIEVGYGLEATLTDAASAQIIRDTIAPRFREQRYAAGLEAAVAAVYERIAPSAPKSPEEMRREAESGRRRQRESESTANLYLLFFLIFAAVTIGGLAWEASHQRGYTGGRRGWSGTRGLGGGWGGGWGGGGWGGGGGGGGFSGGGGSSGGGGASGSW